MNQCKWHCIASAKQLLAHPLVVLEVKRESNIIKTVTGALYKVFRPKRTVSTVIYRTVQCYGMSKVDILMDRANTDAEVLVSWCIWILIIVLFSF